MTRTQLLLAVDIGLHTGLALFSSEQKLLWYRSHHLPSPLKLKKMVSTLLRQTPCPTHIYLEGGGPLAAIWIREAEDLALTIRQIQAEQWRRRLFYRRQHANRSQAKKEADGLARQVIAHFGSRQPTSLRHDTAEAVLIGLYGMLELGWLPDWPIRKGENP